MNNHDNNKKTDKKLSAIIAKAKANIHSNIDENHPTLTLTATKKTQPPSPTLTLIGTNNDIE